MLLTGNSMNSFDVDVDVDVEVEVEVVLEVGI
jgi:hypothetical protein